MTSDTDLDADLPTLRVRGPVDLAEAIPYLLGFHPARSLVLVGVDRGRVVVTARADLDDLIDSDGLLAHTTAAMMRGGARRFIGLVFDDAAAPRPGSGPRALSWAAVAAEVREVVTELSGEVDDVVLVSRQRVWSYFCEMAECCPPEGRPLDTTSSIAAAATFAGMVALPDRASLGALLQPLPDGDRDRLLASLAAGERDAVAMIARGEQRRVDRSVTRTLFAAARAADPSGSEATPAEALIVRFGVALQRYPVRDAVWLAVDDGRLDGRALWRELARRLPSPYDAPALFLLGWAAYRRGDGTLAGIAADRALDSDSGYSAADLLLAALSQAIDPRRLPKLSRRTKLGPRPA